MKAFKKLFTITGTIVFSCICLTSRADPKIMTLEELKGFLKRTFPTYSEEKNNAITVTASDPALKSKLEQFDEADAERKNYAYPKFYGLDEFSRKFPKEALQTHGIKAKQIEKLCREEVYEITFNSILSSTYFSEEERKKAKEQFLKYEVFKDAIDAYTKNVVILRNIPIKVEVAHNKTPKSKTNDCSHGYTKTVTYKLSGSTLEQEQQHLNECLKEFGLSPRGRAAIILMLLFDQKIPQHESEYRVQWISNKTANAYNPETNRMNLNFGIFEITRYICYRFFPNSKTFDDYQREFEEEFEEEFLEKMDSTAFDDCQLKFGEEFFKKTDHEETEEYYENDASSYDMGDSACEIEENQYMDEEEVHNDKSNTESDFRFCFILRKPRKLMTLEEAVEFLEKNKNDGIVTKIEYSTDEHGRKIPTVIESTDSEKISDALDGSLGVNPKPKKTTPEKVAKVLKTEDLRERNLTDEEFKLLGNSSVHEITFNSILESGCFSEEQKSKAKKWLEETADLEWAIYEYLKKCTFIELVDITLKDSKTGETWYSGKQVLKESNNLSEGNRDWLEHLLKEGVIQTETGAEKMILLLLFDEITPPEYRLSWAFPQDRNSSYSYSWNIINLDSSEGTTFQDSIFDVLHEIGHYLHWQTGFYLDFKGWENPFAKKLLLLESKYEKNKQNISLPQSLSGRFAFRKWGETGTPGTQNDLFMRWQMFSRWEGADELLNILGITFGQDGKTICLDALSEVRAMEKQIHYGHNPPIKYEEYKNQFKTQDEQAIFEKIVQEARDRKPDPEALNLLRKLHNLAPEIEVYNPFDDNHPEYSSCTRDRGS